jgi:glyceraldehyde 3-phosphate dehydrogenase
MTPGTKLRVSINGFGRIGRAFYKLAYGREDMEVVAVNDLGDEANLMYLLKYDSAYGNWPLEFKAKFLQEREMAKLPWRDLSIDVVVESTGLFTDFGMAKGHIDSGAKRVVISAPGKGEEGAEGTTVLMGINEAKLATCKVSSNGSCTTNAASPVVAIIEETLDIEKALLDTIHSYTASQSIVDSPNKKDWREGRAAAHNIVPSSTGAATTVTKAVPGVPFFDGISVRVPTIVGSYVDLTFVTKKNTIKEEVNQILTKAAGESRWEGIFRVSKEPLVSSDIIGDTYASIADLEMTRVVGGNLVKVLAWYDNEMGYANTLVRHVAKIGTHLNPGL